MEMYLLKSAACLAIMLLFYKLLLEKENMHVFKRFYLLAIPIISFGIPAISFPEYVVISSEPSGYFNEIRFRKETAEFPILESMAIGIYLLGVLFFGSRFILNLKALLKKAKANPNIELPGATQVLVKEMTDPYTFWSYIYLNREKFQKKQIPKEVMDHELAHVRQRHSADILFVEVLQVILWFFPLIFLLKKAIKLNHEFLADRAVLKNTGNSHHYQHLLLSFSSGTSQSLVNSINYQSIKKRFTVMKKQPSQKAILVRYLLFLPLLAGLLYSFSSKETIVKMEKNVASPEHQKAIDEEFEKISRLPANYVDRSQEQEKATPKMVREYNQWAKQYKENEDALVEKKVWERMKYIYSIMTPEQRKGSEEFPSLNPKQIITIVEDDNAGRNRAVRNRDGNAPPAPTVSKDGEIPMPPPPPPAPAVDDLPAPPPPPPPASPMETLEGWIEEGAKFYFNGKNISGQEALEMFQENGGKDLHIRVENNASGKTVRISPKRKNTASPRETAKSQVPPPPPPPESPIETFEDWIKEGADFYLNGKMVSGQEALQVVKKNNGKNLHIRVNENDSGKTVKISTKKKKANPPNAKDLKSGHFKSTFIGPPQEQDLLKRNC